MDKNFVNIDDLVRQRLLGGEEREPAGAWLRMSELLEKEMPVRPAGFGWRRMFGGMAVLLLLSGLGLGGYKMSSFRSLNGTKGAVVGNTAINNTTNAPVANAPVSNTTVSNTENNTTIASIGDNNANTNTNSDNNINNKNNNETEKNTTTKHHKANNTNNEHDARLLAANAVNGESLDHKVSKSHTAHKPVAAVGEKASVDGVKNADKKFAKADLNNNKDATIPGSPVENATANNSSSKDVKTAAANKTVENPLAETKQTGRRAKNANAVADNNTTVAKNDIVKKAGEAGLVAPDNNIAGKTAATASAEKQSVAKNNKAAVKKSVDTKTHKAAAEQPVASANNAEKTGEKATHSTGNDKNAVAGKGTHYNNKQSTANGVVTKNNMAPSSGAPVVKTDVPADNDVNGNVQLSTGNKTSAAKHGTTAGKTHAVTSKKAIASNTKTGNRVLGATAKTGGTTGNAVSTPAAGSGKAAGKIASVTPPVQRGKHVIQRLIVNQRLVPCGLHQSLIQLDTVSIETVTEEYDLASAKTDASDNTNGTPKGDEVDDTSPIITTADRFGANAKDNNYVSKGKMALEGLNAAFNDIKYKAGHALFSMGVTGGINGTFFGPNNFKGFQFGVTGKLSFSDELAVMGELKYFNRINNNYTLNDDYYQYLPATGGYAKELVKNPYSISNLQSIEMPISLQFSKDKFNFMVGPNLMYAFGINAGEYPTVITTNTPVIVSTPGADNAPKIKANDFNSRFGVGYLLGVSYQVSPKVYLDLRDVQTFWDNSKTTGSKYISSQLYRSPSFQLSIGYRFGKKPKE